MRLNSAEDLDVYQKVYKLAMRAFELSRSFPPEEKFALTSQIRGPPVRYACTYGRHGQNAATRRSFVQ